MIERHWKGIAKRENVQEYIDPCNTEHLKTSKQLNVLFRGRSCKEI